MVASLNRINVINVQFLKGTLRERVLPLGQNTPGRKSPRLALESPSGTNEGLMPVRTHERADDGEEKVKTGEHGGGDTVAYWREKEGKRHLEEEREEKAEEEDPESQKDHRVERDL
ncbi:hypothetical protein NDU88_009466 [Pleurodeles waltl]|uniref:Uncharacterized protein n=1 Tax=Pleurodeles waltl TaxID=8319 RepID=A0AAV7PSA2_PLEWA|nr:hypothetical protein NDU88_009466 [Pleurodeles waltl]